MDGDGSLFVGLTTAEWMAMTFGADILAIPQDDLR